MRCATRNSHNRVGVMSRWATRCTQLVLATTCVITTCDSASRASMTRRARHVWTTGSACSTHSAERRKFPAAFTRAKAAAWPTREDLRCGGADAAAPHAHSSSLHALTPVARRPRYPRRSFDRRLDRRLCVATSRWLCPCSTLHILLGPCEATYSGEPASKCGRWTEVG